MDVDDFDHYIHMRILEQEVGILRDRFSDTDSGKERIAVGVLIRRIAEIEQSLVNKVNS